ncbi:membrane protein [Natranaerovirga hydrolytica]|uniref:Membrane protein n=1 Tax=Natranaerovirga hydrolytica TaxID=680378 RepID=A0A4R1MJF8_9FIRM|nr:YihY/virulence factor BrkB family protein [Natranaerovirga hydrolytica]TCK92846.1 membrane protein [Natranaerovirga hydrolytica]
MIKKTYLFIRQIQKKSSDDNISALSAQLTYFLLLSFFPFVMFLLTLLSYTPITQKEVLAAIGEVFPLEIQGVMNALLREIANNQSNALLSITVVITIWSASKGVLAIVRGLNVAYDIAETRSFLFLRLTSFIYTIIFALIIILTFILLIFGNSILTLILNLFPYTLSFINVMQTVRYLVSILLLFVFFIIIYNAIPNRKISLSEVIPGALFASLGWIIVSISFSYYIDNFGNFSYMYGSLAGIIILLLWLYICSNIIMIGGEINALLAQKKNIKNSS